jgi:hypothetical protein
VREALELGVPTVASDVGFRPEGVRLFRSGEAEHLADIIDDVIISDKHTNRYIPSGQNIVSEYFRIYVNCLRN